MRVSILGPAYPLRGGIAHHVYWLWRELNNRGHTVQVVSFRKLYPRILFPGTSQIDTSHLKLDAHALPTLTPLNPSTWLRAFRQVQAFSPDVIVFQWWQPFFGLLVGTLARLFRKAGFKCIIECHNVLPHESSPFDRLLVKYALSAAGQFIFPLPSQSALTAAIQFCSSERCANIRVWTCCSPRCPGYC